jgi:hypothetical protein
MSQGARRRNTVPDRPAAGFVEAGGYTDLSCGLTPGLMTNKLMLRGSDGSLLSPADKGKPFMA